MTPESDGRAPAPLPTERWMALVWEFVSQTREYSALVLDDAGRVLWANPGAGHILGLEPERIVGRDVREFFTDEDIAAGIPDHELEVAGTHESMQDDRWMSRVDRSRLWATGVTASLSVHAGAPVFLKIFRDHTDRKMLVTTLRNRVDELDRQNGEKNTAIAVLAHELRGPLSAIGMAAEVLLRSPDEAQREGALEIIRRNVGFAARLSEDLEEHSRAVAGKLSLQVEPVVLGGLLEASIEVARQRMGDAGRRVDLLVPPAPLVVEGDRLRLQQVFVNLVANALRYTPEPGRIWITATVEGPDIVVRVSDEGIGIAPDMLERIFEMFTQASAVLPEAGLGVGLALVKKIVELHHGSVQARSEGIGKGSAFSVRLPLLQRRLQRGGILHPAPVRAVAHPGRRPPG